MKKKEANPHLVDAVVKRPIAVCVRHEWHVITFRPKGFVDVCVNCGKRRFVEKLPNLLKDRPFNVKFV